jgi:hypothetical protein
MTASNAPEAVRQAIVDVFDTSFAAINNGNFEEFKSKWEDCTESIINQAPPYAWFGHDAFDQWIAAGAAHSQSLGVSHQSIARDELLTLEVRDDLAYVVMSVELCFLQNGRKMKQRGTQTCVLKNTSHGWRFKAFAYGGEPSTLT